MFKTLDDLKKEEKKNKKNTDSYTGGTSSGLAVENPEEEGKEGKFSGNYNNLIDKAKNTKVDNKNLEDKQKIKITIYKNGFQLDDGPFRPLIDDANKQFMAEIEKGYVPQELVNKGYKDLVVGLEDKKGEDYEEPIVEKKFQAFEGKGVSMGGPTNTGEINKNVEFKVDKSGETTKINIRLHNGDLKTQEFNVTHTINDIHNFVQSMTNIKGTFSLKEGFPPKVLSDKTKSIMELKLQGSTIIQSLN